MIRGKVEAAVVWGGKIRLEVEGLVEDLKEKYRAGVCLQRTSTIRGRRAAALKMTVLGSEEV